MLGECSPVYFHVFACHSPSFPTPTSHHRFAPWVRGRLSEISEHEAAHVQILNTTLAGAGIPAVQACTYDFSVTDPASFVEVASVLEAVGVGA
jgi:hypothetical protein